MGPISATEQSKQYSGRSLGWKMGLGAVTHFQASREVNARQNKTTQKGRKAGGDAEKRTKEARFQT